MVATKTTSTARRKRLYENISCITFDADCGECESNGLSHFDVPDESYGKGCLRGSRLVAEILKEAVQNESFDDLRGVLEEATKHVGVATKGESKRGAAVGLFYCLQEVFNFAASRLDFTEVFKHTFDAHEVDLAEQLDSMREINAEILAGLASNCGAPSRTDGGRVQA